MPTSGFQRLALLLDSELERRFTKWRRLALVMLLALTWVVPACRKQQTSSELLVFAAASTADAVSDVGRDFAADTGKKVLFSFGASRDLARQIRAGAPAHVILSADPETVDGLVDSKHVRSEDRRTFASNRLVVVTPIGRALAFGTPRDLVKAAHLAMGDPKVVPAGKYAQQWLEKEGVWTEVSPHVVPALDVRAALATVESGHAEAGIVYRTDATRSQKVRIVYEVPADKSPTIAYVAAPTMQEREAGATFVEYLTGPKARAIFMKHGFVL
jgi:molybdate transport system substrate-binding protein